jgi:hypothetical protein
MTQESNHGGARPKTSAADKRGGGAKGHMGQPPFVPTDQQRQDVRELASILTAEQIGVKLGISRTTVMRHFAAELQQGVTNAVAIVGSKVLKQALDGDKASQFFFLKTRGGWTQRHEVTGKDGGPVRVQEFDFSGLSLVEKKLLAGTLGTLLQQAENDDERDAA